MSTTRPALIIKVVLDSVSAIDDLLDEVVTNNVRQ
jgi:hypothetical protein